LSIYRSSLFVVSVCESNKARVFGNLSMIKMVSSMIFQFHQSGRLSLETLMCLLVNLFHCIAKRMDIRNHLSFGNVLRVINFCICSPPMHNIGSLHAYGRELQKTVHTKSNNISPFLCTLNLTFHSLREIVFLNYCPLCC